MSELPEIDGRHFRTVLGRFPTGVTVVTADGPDGPAGLTIGSFTSVSLDPPLVAFLPSVTSESWPAIEAAGAFCVNVLGQDQVDLCNRFASREPDKFAGVEWTPGPTGSPVLDGVVAWIDCRIDTIHTAGDHHIVIGRVIDLQPGADTGPLLFGGGSYGAFQAL